MVPIRKLISATDKRLANDTEKLLSIFPEEVWGLILEHISDPDAFRNLINSSLFFRNRLLDKRTLLLFPKVFQILEDRLTKHLEEDEDSVGLEDEGEDDDNTTMCESCGRVRCPQPSSGIFKLRLVCRVWNTAIDNFYQNTQHHYKMNKEISGSKRFEAWATEHFSNVSDENKVEAFINHFQNSHNSNSLERSPFIGRSINLHYVHPEDFEDPEPIPISRLLKEYGHHIWHFTITFEDGGQLSASGNLKLREWLLLLPNLKFLDIAYSCTTSEEEVDFSSDELESAIKYNGLPSFRNLKFLRTRNLPSSVFNNLTQANCHFKYLEIMRNRTHREYEIYSKNFPNLEQFSVQVFTEDEFQKLITSQETWNLTKLHLKFCNKVYIKWEIVFNVLQNKWGNTLQNLVLSLPEAIRTSEQIQIMKKCNSFRLDLPNLKKFKLVISNYSSLDFILPTKNTLKHLKITTKFDIDSPEKSELALKVEEEQIIDFLGYQGRLYESNIWEMFIKLKEISFQECYDQKVGKSWRPRLNQSWKSKVYTRHEWKTNIEVK